MKIDTVEQAIKVLKSKGWTVRVATLEEKRAEAKEEKKHSLAIRRHWRMRQEMRDNFCKECYVLFRPYSNSLGGEIVSGRNLIAWARGVAKKFDPYDDNYKRELKLKRTKRVDMRDE